MRSQRRLVSPENIPQTLFYNTLIGNSSVRFPTAQSVATAFGISVGDISNFTISETNVKLRIDAEYQRESIFYNDSSVTSFEDLEGKMISIGTTGFRANAKMLKVYCPGALSSGINCFWNSVHRIIYAPKIFQWAGSPANENQFYLINSRAKIYSHPDAATNNSGGLEGDLQYALNRGCDINFSSDFTIPDLINDLTFIISGTDIILNFTAPNAVNGIDIYEVYRNGFYCGEVIRGGAIQNLTPVLPIGNGDEIEVFTCDNFYNRKGSNKIIISGL